MFTFYILDDELSKSRTKVTGKHSSVKSKMACPKKSSETKEIAWRKKLYVWRLEVKLFLPNQVINVINQTSFHQVQLGT